MGLISEKSLSPGAFVPRSLRKLLVVDDEEPWLAQVRRFARPWEDPPVEILTASDEEQAISLLHTAHPDCILLDVVLGHSGGSGLNVMRAAAVSEPQPVVVVLTGRADRADAFELARLGAQSLIEKPVSPAELREAVYEALHRPPELTPIVRGMVGHAPLREVIRSTRLTMAKQAVAMSEGNRTGAARLLQMTRQGVQQIIRDTEAGSSGPDDESP